MKRILMLLCVMVLGVSVEAKGKPEIQLWSVDVVRGSVAEGEGQKFRLFILSGQSNMARLDHRSFILPNLEKAFPGDEILIVKSSKPGQPIKRWMDEKGKTNQLYKKLITKVKKELESRKPDSVTFMWMQGERDAKKGDPELYRLSLKNLIKQIRKDTDHQNATVVIGRLNKHLESKGYNATRDVQVAIAEADPNAGWIDLDDLGKGLHYKDDAYQKMGARFVAATVKLLSQKQ